MADTAIALGYCGWTHGCGFAAPLGGSDEGRFRGYRDHDCRIAFAIAIVLSFLAGKGVLQKVVGVSERGLKGRVSKNLGATLSVEQSLRVRQLAEILNKATQVMGARDGAEAWMGRRAMGL